MEIGGSLLALNFVGVAIDQQGHNIAARDHRVYGDRLPVQAALPPGSKTGDTGGATAIPSNWKQKGRSEALR